MKIEFDTDRYVRDLEGSEEYFYTFIDRDGLAAGVLSLDPGDEDTQGPHESDEVYYIVRGDGFLRIGRKDHAVSAGRVFFVARNKEHFFHGNTERLVALYFFGCPD